MWDHQVAALAKRHRVVRYDWRGHGESGPAAGEFAHHADLLALLDAIGIEQAALVGCSMGGAYAVDVALAAPERMTALALIASGLSGHEWPAAMGAQARERILAAVPADRLARYREHTAGHVDPPAKPRLADVVQPALVVNGRADLPYIQEVSGLLADGIPGARRVDLDDTGHLPPVERPAEVTALLTQFLARPAG